jgi:hypothetical protein
MTETLALDFLWTDGGVMRPINARIAGRIYVVGERYRLAPWEERSAATHSHEFAWLAEAWRNLPERFADLYPSPEHLRKRALIEGGWYDEEIIDVGSQAGALRVAASLRKIDDFALVIVRGVYVIRRTAKSQSRRSMNRQEFQASKTAIMEVISEMIGTTPAQLANAEAA